jgi:hypothetical protein
MDKDKWFKLSKAQQLGNIGSEIARAQHWQENNDLTNRQKALERCLELLDLSLNDKRWGPGLKEIARFREVVSAWFSNQDFFNISPQELQDYCVDFVISSKYQAQ